MHQSTLGWCVSKLKHVLGRDEFPAWQVELLLEMGNERGNNIWEKQIPIGWNKITSGSSLEKRRNWVSAKYQWYAFISDNVQAGGGVRFDEKGLMTSIANGVTVDDVHVFLSRRVDINRRHVLGEEGLMMLLPTTTTTTTTTPTTTALHLALACRNSLVALFLLVNGSDYTAEDALHLSNLIDSPEFDPYCI